MLDRDLITENMDSIAKLYDLLADDESRNVLTMMLKFRITMDPRLIKCSAYRQYHHPEVSPVHGDFLLDGGAFTGDTVLDFSRTLQGKIKGVCFEPDKENFKILEHNLYANKLDRKFKAVPLGLWSKSATLSFDSASQSSRIVENSSNSIKVIDIDTYCKRTGLAPDLIKMDVEGAELEALAGGESTIKTLKPKMMVSAYHHGIHLWEIPLRLADMGYNEIFLGHHPPEYTIYETVVYCR
ncbi:FkbM family methyltransferase [Desulfonatronovibrio magnus]|uniref:FkbM family methyltransferase n=1 Tax=Desulfonatronovibrio magnus TaxID=698827 RepID=UPI0005EBB608|nr:FkbM family methyltransferase [Desulfonatronovibrio magnus]